MGEKKLVEYLPERPETVHLSARVPVDLKIRLKAKMARDGIINFQDWLRAAIKKYLEEK